MAPSQPPGKGRGRTSGPGFGALPGAQRGGAAVGGARDRTISHRGGGGFPLGDTPGSTAGEHRGSRGSLQSVPATPVLASPGLRARAGRGRGRPRGCAPPGLGSASRGRSLRRAAVSLRRRPGRRFIAGSQRGATARTPRGLRVASPCCPGRRAGEALGDARLSGDAVPAPRVKGVGSGRAAGAARRSPPRSPFFLRTQLLWGWDPEVPRGRRGQPCLGAGVG